MDPTTTVHHINFFGSMGKAGDSTTAGGGSIIIIVDSVHIEGQDVKLTSNGMPEEKTKLDQKRSGGSGGFVYVSTSNHKNENKIDPYFTIGAVGGSGIEGGFGGSGGIGVADGNLTVESNNVRAGGGRALNSTESCANGAAGTFYTAASDKLIIDNQDHDSTVWTKISLSDEISAIQLSGGARVEVN